MTDDAPSVPREPTSDEVEAVARQIVEYLSERPDAADTAVGVWKWWWSLRELRRTRRLVEAALGLLERRGVLATRAGSDGEVVYFKNKE